MATAFEKLNLKQQPAIVVLNAPASFEPELSALTGVTVQRSLASSKPAEFLLAFVTRQQEVDAIAAQLAAHAPGDAIIWFAYPKGTSKRYKCEFNRDTGWAALGAAGFEPVRQVAIDADWSALRFRRVEFIKSMTRVKLQAMTEQGKARTERLFEKPTHLNAKAQRCRDAKKTQWGCMAFPLRLRVSALTLLPFQTVSG